MLTVRFPPPHPTNVMKLLRLEWAPISTVAALCVAAGLIATWGLAGVDTFLTYPVVAVGDGLSHAWWVKRILDGGWFYESARNGYPFGSDLYDYASSDQFNFFLFWLIGLLVGENYAAAINLYYVLSFATCAIASYVVCRVFGLGIFLTMALAVVYTFLPFHFYRTAHLFYVWYWPAPVAFLLGVWIALPDTRGTLTRWGLVGIALTLAMIGSAGVYYAAFSIVVVAYSALFGAARTGTVHSLVIGGSAVLLIAGAVLLNILPNVLHEIRLGDNPAVAERMVAESEIYGLKIVQLLLPHLDHRWGDLADIANEYVALGMPLVNENTSASLGLIGSIGFLVTLLVLLIGLARPLNPRLTFLSGAVVMLILLATVGGFSVIFAWVVSPSLRGWNRVSPFIAFPCLLTLFLVLEASVRLAVARYARPVLIATATGLSALAIIEQTPETLPDQVAAGARITENLDQFYTELEREVPPGTPVYQMPYISFPEMPPIEKMGGYEQLVGFLLTDDLRFSHAAMRGREGDQMLERLQRLPIEELVPALRSLGFGAVEVVGYGYADNGERVLRELEAVLGPPIVDDPVTGRTAFAVDAPLPPLPEHAAYGDAVDRLRNMFPRERIDLSEDRLPLHVMSVEGLSHPEPFGRWTDANLADAARLTFLAPFEDEILVRLTLMPFGPNIGRPLRVVIGNVERSVMLEAGMRDYVLEFSGVAGEDTLVVVPPKPVLPGNGDPRRIGVGIEAIDVGPTAPDAATRTSRLSGTD